MTEHTFNNHAHTYCKHWHNPVPFILVYSAENIKAQNLLLPTIKKVSFSHLKSDFTVTFLPSKSLWCWTSSLYSPLAQSSFIILLSFCLSENDFRKCMLNLSAWGDRMWHWDTLARLLFTLMEDQPKDWTVMDLGSPGVLRATAAPLLLFVLCNTSHFVFNMVKSL